MQLEAQVFQRGKELLVDRTRIVDFLRKIAEEMHSLFMEYPPEYPKVGVWWERGYGWKWAGGGDPISEHLKESWRLYEEGKGTTVVLANSASYAHLVHGTDYQWDLHREWGWLTASEIFEKSLQNVGQELLEEMVQAN